MRKNLLASESDERAIVGGWVRRWLAGVLLLGLLLRVVVLVRSGERMEDPDNYLPLAQAVARGEGLSHKGRPTAYRPPLYPLVLAPLVSLLGERVALGVAALHLVLGAATIASTAAAARLWPLSDRRTLAAAVIVACDPVLVSQARAVMTETLAAFLVALSLAGLALRGRRGSVVGGVGFGMAALCRPSLLPAGVLVGLAALLAPPGRTADRVGRAMLMIGTMAATLAPWAWRNVGAVGEPVLTTTHGGYTLALANNPVYYDDVLNGPPGAVWSGPRQRDWWEQVNRENAGLAEPVADRRMRATALRVMIERPRDFVRASLARLGRFWGLAPSGAVYPLWLRLATALWTMPLWAALALGLTRRELWAWPRVSAPLMILALSTVHLFYWTDLRMRAPLVPAIALIAAGAGFSRPFRGLPLTHWEQDHAAT